MLEPLLPYSTIRMIIWLKNGDNGDWTSCPSILGGLENISSSQCREILLYSDSLPEDIGEIESFLRLASRLNLNADNIIAATPHPSVGSLRALHSAGIKTLMITTITGSKFETGDTYSLENISSTCCDLLHYRADKQPLSVCGAHEDRMVVGIKHIQDFCFKNHAACAHWRMAEHLHNKSGKDEIR